MNVKYQITVDKTHPEKKGAEITKRPGTSFMERLQDLRLPGKGFGQENQKSRPHISAEKLTLGINKTLFISIRAFLKLKC